MKWAEACHYDPLAPARHQFHYRRHPPPRGTASTNWDPQEQPDSFFRAWQSR